MSILNNISPMSDCAELVMLIKQAHSQNIKQRIDDLHAWAEIYFKKLDQGMKCLSTKSFMKIPRHVGTFTDLAFRGPACGFRQWQNISLSGCADRYKLAYLESREAAVCNVHYDRMFYDIYEIPNELFNELKDLCQNQ